MRGTVVMSLLLFFGFLVWRITDRLSPDALGLATGVLLGVLAGLPIALLLLAASRRRTRDAEEEEADYGQPMHHAGGRLPMQPQQPPVIILSGYPQGYGAQQTGGYANGYGTPQRSLPAPTEYVDSRRFHVVGEEDEGVEEW